MDTSTNKPFPNIDIFLDGTDRIQNNARDKQIEDKIEHSQVDEYTRIISIYRSEEAAKKFPDSPIGRLNEQILLWPSAPIFALGWPRRHHIESNVRSTWHTMRILKRPKQESIDRISLFFNGLNETFTFQTYYRLADLLFWNEEHRRNNRNAQAKRPHTEEKQYILAKSACIIRPFPGHLTRHPHTGGYNKLPMAHYLEDAAELYRQFLRYMIETQWLLSALIPFKSVPFRTGLTLLQGSGSENAEEIAESILASWQNLSSADLQAQEQSISQKNYHATPISITEIKAPDKKILTEQIERLRNAVGWKGAPTKWKTNPDTKSADTAFHPQSFHAIGYSMGGFVAQASMFTWPQIFATCSMLASGGSLSDVQASFVHEDEWLYVLDRLPNDLENAAIAGQIPLGPEHKSIYGLPSSTYSAFRRAFDQVFLQRSIRRREYISWLEEFHARLFFVLGGRDPVVKAANVIDSASRLGINAIEISGLKHELHDRNHEEWQKFWLPRVVTRTIEDFEQRGEFAHLQRLENYWKAPSSSSGTVSPTSEVKSNKDQSKNGRRELSLFEFERMVDEAIEQMSIVNQRQIPSDTPDVDNYMKKFEPFVLIARNRVPVELFLKEFLEKYGVVRHYDETLVAEAEQNRLDRGAKLRLLGDRLRVILPKDFVTIEEAAVAGPLAHWPNATGNDSWTKKDTQEICNKLEEEWKNQLLLWAPQERAKQTRADTLPDCWYIFGRAWMIQTESHGEEGWPTVIDGIAKTIKELSKAAPKTARHEKSAAALEAKFLSWVGGVRIFKVSPAHTGARYAGYEILGGHEKLDALKHLEAVLSDSVPLPTAFKLEL